MKARHPTAWAVAALSLFAFNATARADSDGDRERDRHRDRTVLVDCAAGETVARALTRGDDRKSLTILISGICGEHVVINRSDIKLAAAAAGATISGPDPTIDTIRVTGSRVTMDGITVTGGRNGITADGAPGLIVQNALLQGTGRNGISYVHGASGIVDGTTVTGNARDGVGIDSAQGTVIHSQVNQNGRHGVGVFNGGTARIGIDNAGNPGGNVINANAVNGIQIAFGSTALIAMNQVTGNGTSTDPAAQKIGINVVSSTADLIGGNTISGNAGTGVNLIRSSAQIGDPNFDFTTANTVSGNGNPASQGGVSAFLGSSLTIRGDAVITGNVGFGVSLSLNSSLQIAATRIRNNTAIPGPIPGTLTGGHGIQLQLGSGLLAQAPAGSVTGNAGFGVLCSDGESSVAGLGGIVAALNIGLNGLGTVSCTGF